MDVCREVIDNVKLELFFTLNLRIYNFFTVETLQSKTLTVLSVNITGIDSV